MMDFLRSPSAATEEKDLPRRSRLRPPPAPRHARPDSPPAQASADHDEVGALDAEVYAVVRRGVLEGPDRRVSVSSRRPGPLPQSCTPGPPSARAEDLGVGPGVGRVVRVGPRAQMILVPRGK